MLTVDTHHVAGYICEECKDAYGEQYEKEDGVLPLATAKDGAKAGKPKPVEPAPAAVASGTNVLDHARKPLLKSDTSDDIRVDVNFK